MRYIVKVAAVVGIVAGSIVASTNAASAAPISGQVVKSSPIVGHPKCPRCVGQPGTGHRGPFKVTPVGPSHGPVMR